MSGLAKALRVERLARAIEEMAVKASSPKRGCLMAMVYGTLENDLLAWGKANVPDDALDPNEGREIETHVTVYYGFNLDFDSVRLMVMLRNHGEVSFTLGKVSRFECPDYDVLKVDVDSPQLERLNRDIGRVFAKDVTPSEHEYHPHVTIAYVQKGACKGLDGSAEFAGRKVTVEELLYSLPERKGRQTVSLERVDAVQASEHDVTGEARDEVGRFSTSGKVGRHLIYHSPLRPVLSISHYLPKGWQFHGEVKNAGEHRTFSVPRPLTSKEVEQWELEPDDPHHPVNIKKAYSKFHDEVVDKYAEKGVLKMKTPSGDLILSETIGDEKYPFRITRFTKEGVPSGHDTFRDFDEVTRHLFGYGNNSTIEATDQNEEQELVKATEREDTLIRQDQVRSDAQRDYQKRVNRVVAALEASAVADLKRKEESDKARKKRRDEELAAAALLLFLAGKQAYTSLYSALGKILGQTTHLQPTNAPSQAQQAATTLPGAGGATPGDPADRRMVVVPTPADPEEATKHAESRSSLLADFPQAVVDRLDKAARKAQEAGQSDEEVADVLRRTAEDIEAGQAAVVAQSETQSAYGSAQLRLLDRAGFATVMWDQLDRPTKRHTHELNMQLGPVPLGYMFPTGQQYPGDPRGGPENNINCLCQILGVARKPGSGHLQP